MSTSPDPRIPQNVSENFLKLRAAGRALRMTSAEKKNAVLELLAKKIISANDQILKANAEDLNRLSADSPSAFRDRLLLNSQRLGAMAESLRQVAKLPDPVGEVIEEKVLINGLKLKRVRAPLGVILMIFESRPNVALEAFSLAFKAGNTIALRGGSESKSTVSVFYSLMREALNETGLSPDLFYGINDYDRAIVDALLLRKDWIDVVVPRGGERLIEHVVENALMPIIKNDRGLCHAYVDAEADLSMAIDIVENAKTSRPGVCNSLETVLVNRKVAAEFLPRLYEKTTAVGLQWRCDQDAFAILKGRKNIELATKKDWDTEHLEQILNCAIVNDLDQALTHIALHGSKHSEAIITKNENQARLFQNEVDAAAVYWNASTRFTDGFEFGLGGELGISTQKLHVRGPVGLRELTTPRWIIDGSGQIRL